jgi:hypothetical protein
LASKTLLSPIGTGKKTFSSTLNFMTSQMVKNDCVKFGRHVNRQVNYKILWLTPKDLHVFLAKTASNQPLLKTR